jgi:hypothetical protein
MQIFEKLTESKFYHIYNRGINSEKIFREERNYDYFMQLYWEYISPVADTYCFSLLKSSFNFLIRIKDILPLYEPPFRPPAIKSSSKKIFSDLQVNTGIEKKLSPSGQFSHFFNAYAQAFNNSFNRTGGLFETPFRQKCIYNEASLRWLTRYIHHSPEYHNIIDDFKSWPYSSWHSLLLNTHSSLQRNEVISWFGTEENFVEFHSIKQQTGAILLLNKVLVHL